MLHVVKSILVFIVLELIVLMVITYWPGLSLWLVHLTGTQ